ncbi:S100P-binding protein [Parambassis ranga]|uniref:S100P-binding protein n=1 Tax=Parambassis ranga TaxID=210632 RepID=A0A6P7HML1_9TELE|nr:uncharacterized protein LOC114427780 [Parambassis ranga]
MVHPKLDSAAGNLNLGTHPLPLRARSRFQTLKRATKGSTIFRELRQVKTSSVAFFTDADMRTHISSRMVTCDQQIRRSHPYINFKIKVDTCQNKRYLNDYRRNDGYETPSKQPSYPAAVSPDLGCVMDYPSPPARPVAFNELHLERKKRLYVQSVTDHMNERPGAIQGVMAELHNLITHMGEKIPTSSGEQWQHPADFTRKNYHVRSGSTTPMMTLHDWQAKNEITYRRFARVPKIFERSSYRP